MSQIKVATVSQLPNDSQLLVEVGDLRVALFNLQGEIFAIEDLCTHDGGPLVEGEVVNGNEVECPRHGARFDIRTGTALSFPAFQATQSFAVTVEGEDILIEMPTD